MIQETQRSLKPGDRVTIRRGVDSHYAVTFLSPGHCGRPGYLNGCRQYVLWCRTDGGKMMPVNRDPDESGLYTAHQKTCPDSKLFRGRHP